MVGFRNNYFILQKSGTVDSETGRRYKEFLQQHKGLLFQDDNASASVVSTLRASRY